LAFPLDPVFRDCEVGRGDRAKHKGRLNVKGFWSKAVLAAMLALPATAHAQIYGQFTGAETVPTGGHVFGAYVHASEDLFGLVSQLRLSFYPNVDFGFQGGLNRIEVAGDDQTTLRVGGDLKFLILKGNLLDLGAGGALGVETGDGFSVLTLGPSVVVSKNFALGSGAGIIPYASMGMFLSNENLGDNQSSDFSIPFRFGSEFKLSPEIKLVAEIQLRAGDEINDYFSFVTGVNLPF
jgi:hypothetical protein